MNVGKDKAKALQAALANAKLDNKPRYLHLYNGVWWIEKEPPKCQYYIIYPTGEMKDYNIIGIKNESVNRTTDS